MKKFTLSSADDDEIEELVDYILEFHYDNRKYVWSTFKNTVSRYYAIVPYKSILDGIRGKRLRSYTHIRKYVKQEVKRMKVRKRRREGE